MVKVTFSPAGDVFQISDGTQPAFFVPICDATALLAGIGLAMRDAITDARVDKTEIEPVPKQTGGMTACRSWLRSLSDPNSCANCGLTAQAHLVRVSR